MTMKLIVLLGILATIASILGMRVEFKDCVVGEKKVTVNYVEISPCTLQPCTVYKGKNSTIKINFNTLSQGATNLTASIFAIIEGQELPYPDPLPDACQNSGMICPVAPSSEYTYQTSLTIPKLVPKMMLTVGFRLKDHKGEIFMCVEIPLIVASSKMSPHPKSI